MSDNQNATTNNNGTSTKTKQKTKAPAATAKSKKPQLTPRQAEIRSQTLIRGIDNSMTKIKKEVASIEAARKELPRLVTGLANQATTPAKSEKTTKVAAAAKKSETAAKKSARPKATPKKAAAPKAAPKTVAAAKKSVPSQVSQNRPTFKEVAIRLLQKHGPTERAKLRNMYMTDHGKISSQSTYGVYKNNPETFRVDDKGIVSYIGGKSASKSGGKESDIDSFVARVESDRATSAAV